MAKNYGNKPTNNKETKRKALKLNEKRNAKKLRMKNKHLIKSN